MAAAAVAGAAGGRVGGPLGRASAAASRVDSPRSRARGPQGPFRGPRCPAPACRPAGRGSRWTPRRRSHCAAAALESAISFAEGLPIHDVLPDILRCMEENPSAVLQAPPGAGKTTCVPLAMLLSDASYLAGGKKILMLEPRRLAAKAAARRLSALVGDKVGGIVGYRVRHETVVSSKTRIEVMTEGTIIRMLQSDPSLTGVGAVLLDEFHERSLEADLALALVKDVQQLDRTDLRVLVMSATLGGGVAERCAEVLGQTEEGSDIAAPLLISDGRSYPVDIRYLGAAGVGRGALEDFVARAVVQALEEQDEGDILCFLPGVGEIRRVEERLDSARRPPAEVMPLYGDLSPEAQDRAIRPSPDGTRRVVLATPIAESSLTIAGVRVVVDTGLHRSPRFDSVTGMDKLNVQKISKASADQRAGRAGRTAPGVCYRLWSEHTQNNLADFTTPQILTSDLTPLALELACWGVPDGKGLTWLDCPPERGLSEGRSQLEQLAALDSRGGVLPLGRSMSMLATHPKLASMLIRAKSAGLGDIGALLAALLTERDPLARGAGADIHLRYLGLTGEAPSGIAVDRGVVHRVGQAAKQLAGQLSKIGVEGCAGEDLGGVPDEELLGLLLAMAYPDRIAQRRDRSNSTAAYLLASGRGARLPGKRDPLAQSEYLVVAQLGGDTRGGRNENIFLATPISMETVSAHLQHLLRTERVVFWAPSKKAVMGRLRTMIGAIAVKETPLEVADEEAIPAILEGVAESGLKIFSWSNATLAWRDRALLAAVKLWLSPFLSGVRTRGHLEKVDVNTAVRCLLTWDQQQTVNAFAPEKLVMPSGSSFAVNYAEDSPFIKVRIQEVFGLSETPALMGGRLPVVLHLLSPSQRPIQVTSDLSSFWETQYVEVAKDMRGRYPKHFWPEDPLEARATRKTKKQMDAEQSR